MENTLVVLLGPTAVGKTEVALRVAEALHTPIVNADSRQVYRDIPIVSAAPSEAEQRRVRHYFVGTHSLADRFSAAAFETQALDTIGREFERRDTVVMSGGSMLYLDAVTRGIDDMPEADPEVRREVRRMFDEDGLEPLLAQLRLLDPEYYTRVDKRNPQRVIHGVEMCLSTGRPFSSFHTGQRKARPFRIVKIGLQRPRPELYERIERRVDVMLESGAVEEARRVLFAIASARTEHDKISSVTSDVDAVAPFPTPDQLRQLMVAMPSLNTVGLRELLMWLVGEYTLDDARERIVHATKVYSKKQMTWFQRDREIRWLHPDDDDVVSITLDAAKA